MDEGSLYILTVPGREIKETKDSPIVTRPPGELWHAQFACLIGVRTARQLDDLRWGFNLGALLDEALDRQLLFVESQHFPGEIGEPDPPYPCSLAVRCVHDPDVGNLQLALIVKNSAPTEEEAYRIAQLRWQELCSIFPYDYELVPADSDKTFFRLAGWRFVDQCVDPQDFTEVLRYEQEVRPERFYVLGAWRRSKTANEQVWRTLAGARKPILFDITLQPTVLRMYEQDALSTVTKKAQDVVKKEEASLFSKAYANYMSTNTSDLIDFLRRPFIVQVRVLSPSGVPDYIPRAIGFAFTHSGAEIATTPGFQLISPKDKGEVEDWISQLIWLEPDLKPGPFTPKYCERLRKMVDARDARQLLCLPYPPGDGIPGVSFASE
jgi:hypothetical protein